MKSTIKKRILSLFLILSLMLTGNVQSVSAEQTQITAVSGLTLTSQPDLSVLLDWKWPEYVSEPDGTGIIVILRSQKEEGPYECVKVMHNNLVDLNSYTDQDVKPRETYFYKVINYEGEITEDVLEYETEPSKITVGYLSRPVISAVKGKSAGRKYVEITIHEYTGKHIEIYMKDLGKYKKLDIKSGVGSTIKKKYRFRYKVGGITLSFKARTYQKIDGKRRYSKYSKVVKIKL